jgi:hypothetical protein
VVVFEDVVHEEDSEDEADLEMRVDSLVRLYSWVL